MNYIEPDGISGQQYLESLKNAAKCIKSAGKHIRDARNIRDTLTLEQADQLLGMIRGSIYQLHDFEKREGQK